MPSLIRTHEISCVVCGGNSSQVLATGQDIFNRCSEQTFSMVTCRDCDHTYLNPRPISDDLHLIYPEEEYYAYKVESESRKTTGNRLLSQFFAFRNRRRLSAYVNHFRSRIRNGERLRILDLGCGDGTRLDYWRSVFPNSATFGLELSSRAGERARARGHQVQTRRIEEAQFEPAGYDIIHSAYLIEHLADPQALLVQCRKWLKPGGLIVIVMPSTDSIDFRIFQKGRWGMYCFPQHWNLFSLRNFTEIAGKLGLEIVRSSYSPSATSWIWSLHLLFRSFSPRWAEKLFPTKSVLYSGSPYNWLILTVFTLWDYLMIMCFKSSSDLAVTLVPMRAEDHQTSAKQ